ncbi:MAG: hypothetical protein ACOZNI_28720 [Myxococcota bacterium]
MAGNPQDLVLYLVLSPEFGGTRFGPFEGIEARLGSNKERCHITLPEALGVAKEHCKVIRQGGTNMILAPSERTAAVFLWKGDARRPMQVQTPTAVRPGDSFSLVTPDGPRFLIELGELPAEVKAARAPASRRGPRGLTAGRLADEAKRMGIARLLTYGPLAIANRAWYFVKSGTIWQPRYIILGTIMLFGYLTSGVASCTAFKFKSDVFSAEKKLENCKSDLAYAEDMGKDVENFAFDQLASRIIGVNSVGNAMKKDPQLLDKVKAEAKKIAANPEWYAWMLDEQSARVEEFAKWRERVDKSEELDPDTKKLVPWLAAQKQRLKGSWDKVLDSKEIEVCGRGPIRMTYRQGRNLGLDSVQLDAYVAGDATQIVEDVGEKTKLLGRTAEAAGEPQPDGNLASTAENLRQGVSTCVYAEGDDDRENASKVLSMLHDQIGKDAKLVPDVDNAFGPVARVAKYFAADVPSAKFTDAKTSPIDFSKGNPMGALADLPGGSWVVDRTAEVIARALVIPCDAALNGDKGKLEAVFGTLPSAVPCLVLNYRLTHDGT